MNYLQEELYTNQLIGKTCFISRVKEKNIKCDFSTLHSLVYKVLRKSNTYHNKSDLNKNLSGELMKEYIKRASIKSSGKTPSDKQLLTYYYSLRNHENSSTNFNKISEGNLLLNNYQQIKGDEMDWEESMQLATRYLKDDIVKTIEKFDFDNIVLLQPELLNQKRNKNALEFFLAFRDWSIRHTDWNIFQINKNGEIYCYDKKLNHPVTNSYQVQ